MEKSNPTRRKFIFIATGTVIAAGAGLSLYPIFKEMTPAGDALPHLTVDLTAIEKGKDIKFMVDKQIYRIRHLRDQTIANFSPEKIAPYQILHAGCPNDSCIVISNDMEVDYNNDEFGYYCACCGAHYNALGHHIRGGPTKKDIEVPEYSYISENVVGFKRIPAFAR